VQRFRTWAGRDLFLWLQLTLAADVLMMISVQLLRPSARDTLVLSLDAVACLAAGIAWAKIAPDQLIRRFPMLPVLGFLALALTGVLTDSVNPSFTGFYTVGFVYIGLTRPRGTSLALAPLALGCWLLTNAPVTSQIAARIPVNLGTWLLVGEILAGVTAAQLAAERRLSDLAHTDTLTTLASRSMLGPSLADLRDGDCVVFLDLDHFKRVNDTLGHSVGDQVLADFGRVVQAVMRQDDTAIRYGGEEILLVLRRAGAKGADRLLERLQRAWSAAHPSITFSAGIARVDSLGSEAAVERADEALYAAKNAGRNQWRYAEQLATATVS
jgi:diguanylate cyclase (GGDEF)-like protein